MASMFNICAIAIPWRIVNPASKEANGEHVPDPEWLVAVNIVSLVIAVLANLSLLGQMTNKLRYNISGPITIIGFFISGLVDIALVGAAQADLTLPPTPNATYSQAVCTPVPPTGRRQSSPLPTIVQLLTCTQSSITRHYLALYT
jgi:potassium channel subfamily K